MPKIPSLSSLISLIVPLLKEFEGYRSHAYWDGTQYSIGFGSGKYADGTDVAEGDVVTEAKGLAMLKADLLNTRFPAVEKLVKVDLTPGMTAALLSFAYNKGVGGLKRSSILEKLNAGEPLKVVAREFAKYNKNVAGVEKLGLTRRRAAEAKVFLS